MNRLRTVLILTCLGQPWGCLVRSGQVSAKEMKLAATGESEHFAQTDIFRVHSLSDLRPLYYVVAAVAAVMVLRPVPDAG